MTPPEGFDTFEAYGLHLIDKHRKDLIKTANYPTKSWFKHRYKEYAIKTATGLSRIYINNGHDVLFVGHLDTVHDPKPKGFHWNRVRTKDGRAAIKMPMCDDRLGVGTGLHVLPGLGLKYDILLTEGEERGKSTAEGFRPPKDRKYNWIFEFDRTGDDVVLYAYKDSDWSKAVKDAGFAIGRGSTSDISYMQDLGCKAMNIGTGYYNYHEWDAYFVVEEWARSICLFKAFYDKHKDTHFPHTKKKYTHKRGTGWASSSNWKAGMVVSVKTGTRKQQPAPTMGILNNNYRRTTWTMINRKGYVIDTPETWDIIEHVKCDNCGLGLYESYHEIGNKIVCDNCADIIGKVDEAIRVAFTTGSGFIELASGELLQIGKVSEYGIWTVDPREFVTKAVLKGATVPDGFREGSLVTVPSVSGNHEFVLKKIEDDRAYLSLKGHATMWGVPLEIVEIKGDTTNA